MKKIIHHVKKIRTQPEHIRRSVLHITVGIFAVILFLLWVYSLGTTMRSPEVKAKVYQEVKPFSILKDNISGQYNNLSGSDSEIDLSSELESL